MPCQCSEWSDRVRINLGYETADLLREGYDLLRARNPWLDLARCRSCGQHWYVAVDTLDDDYYFRRLSTSELAAIVEADEWAVGRRHGSRAHSARIPKNDRLQLDVGVMPK